MRNRFLCLGLAVAAISIVGCDEEELTEDTVNAELEDLWATASAKSAFEGDVEPLLLSALRSEFKGDTYTTATRATFTVDTISWVTVDIGNTPPVLVIDDFTYRLSSPGSTWGDTFVIFSYTLTWASGNDSEVRFYVDGSVGSTSRDLVVEVSDIAGTVEGTCYFEIDPDTGNMTTLENTVDGWSLTATWSGSSYFPNASAKNHIEEILANYLLGEAVAYAVEEGFGS